MRSGAAAIGAVLALTAGVLSLSSASAADLPVTAAPIQYWDARYTVEPPEECERPRNGPGKGHDKGNKNGHDCDRATGSPSAPIDDAAGAEEP